MRFLVCTGLVSALLATVVFGDDDNQKSTTTPKIRISKKTTYILGPIDKDGYVDYAAALNSHLSKGVTPNNNAVVLLVRALGAAKFSEEIRKDYFTKLGVTFPAKGERRFLSLEDYAIHVSGKKGSRFSEELYKEQGDSTLAPWSRRKFPKLAAWLEYNQEPLKLIVEASRRSRWYEPIVPVRNKTSGLIVLRSRMSGFARGFGRALLARAGLAIDEGRIDDAQRDILACRRLARLLTYGLTFERLVGAAFEALAFEADQQLLRSGKQTARQLFEYQRGLAGRPSAASLTERISVAERMVLLAEAVQFSRSGKKGREQLADVFNLLDFEDKLKNLRSTMFAKPFDWNVLLESLNAGWDEPGFEKPSSPPFQATVTALKKSISKRRLRLESANRRGDLTRKERSELLADFLIWCYASNFNVSVTTENRAVTRDRLIRIAVALERCKRTTGRYPASLTSLKPRFLKSVPGDLYSEKPFLYRLSKSGYLLYSVGENRKDDGGKSYCVTQDWDDIVVRMDGSKPPCP